jgi:ABC-type multidrug transport system ATPase subunit
VTIGKSTTINIVTGLQRPTSGAISCFGTGDLDTIQKMIGVTEQSDVTWPKLSAAQHLKLFAWFKQISAPIDEYVMTHLEKLGLEAQADQLVGTFSGGMRRRLSILLCSVGRPPLCVLDEPTASLDPIHRRKVWQFIRELQEHAAVILTTHLLDEADQLGDQILILDEGEVKAYDTALALKKTYGDGYEINLLLQEGTNVPELTALIKHYAPSAKSNPRSAETLLVTIPSDSSEIIDLTRALQSNDIQVRNSVREWNITNASLEQAFLNIVGNHNPDSFETGPSQSVPVNSLVELPKFTISKSLWKQSCAVVLKNASYQRRQKKSSLLVALISIACLGLLVYVLNLVQRSEKELCPGGYLKLIDDTCDLEAFAQKVTGMASLMCSSKNPFLCTQAKFQYGTQSTIKGNSTSRYWIWDQSGNATSIFQDADNVDWKGIKLSIEQSLVPSGKLNSSLEFPERPIEVRFVAEDPNALIQKKVLEWQQRAIAPPSQCKASSKMIPISQRDLAMSFKESFPDFGVTVEKVDKSNLALSLSLAPDPDQDVSPYAMFKDENSQCSVADSKPNYVWKAAMGAMIPSVANSVLLVSNERESLLHGLLQSFISSFVKNVQGGPQDVIQGSLMEFPRVSYLAAAIITFIFLGPLCIFVLFGFFLSVPFMERESKLGEFYAVNGMFPMASWTGHVMFCQLMAFSICFPLTIIAVIFFSKSSSLIFFLLTVQGSLAVIGIAFLVAALPLYQSIVRCLTFICPIILTLLSGIYVILGKSKLYSSAMFPTIPFVHNLKRLLMNLPVDWGLYFVGLGISVLYMIVGIALHSVNWEAIYRTIMIKFARIKAEEQSKWPGDAENVSFDDVEGDEVRKERLRLLSKSGAKEKDVDVIRVLDVSKNYGSHKALQNIFLGVAKGSVFGLLGHNGAGKSTLLNILMGDVAPSRGIAEMAGISCTSRNLSSVLGVCPQQDRAILELSVEENLLFFARIRGAPLHGKALKDLVMQYATLVDLGPALNVLARSLSGGMRRRLSIAIAILGTPEIILADEPSAGLDPSNRMGIWKLIQAIQQSGNSTMVITTHSMTEADALCSRIGIMAGGRMRVLGSQVSLKNKYGEGFKLAIQLPICVESNLLSKAAEREKETVRDVVDSLASFIFPPNPDDSSSPASLPVQMDQNESQALSRARAGRVCGEHVFWDIRLGVQLPLSVDLSKVFEFMTLKQSVVVHWNVSQSSLDDVFYNISKPYCR